MLLNTRWWPICHGQIHTMKKLNQNIFCLKYPSSKGFFDLWNVRNRLKIFWKCHKDSLMTKRHCKGDTVEDKVVDNFPWKNLKTKTSSLKFSSSRGFFGLRNTRNRLKLFREGYKGSIISKRHCKGDKLEFFNGAKWSATMFCLAINSTHHQSFNQSINQSIIQSINQFISWSIESDWPNWISWGKTSFTRSVNMDAVPM